jgi:predicted AAA+ superfamily ATPase
LLDLGSQYALEGHPKIGASWEGFAIEALVAHLGVRWDQCHFWATHAGAELDVLVLSGRRRLGFEIKRTDTPRLTPSMRHALADLRLDELTVIHAGKDAFTLAKRVRAVPLARLIRDVGRVAAAR